MRQVTLKSDGAAMLTRKIQYPVPSPKADLRVWRTWLNTLDPYVLYEYTESIRLVLKRHPMWEDKSERLEPWFTVSVSPFVDAHNILTLPQTDGTLETLSLSKCFRKVRESKVQSRKWKKSEKKKRMLRETTLQVRRLVCETNKDQPRLLKMAKAWMKKQ